MAVPHLPIDRDPIIRLEEKLAILEDLEELTITMGYQRDPTTGRLRKSNL